MNRVAPSPVSPGDDLDVLLGAFFKGEMPAPWPAFSPSASARTLPLPARRIAPPRGLAFNSRLSLVASVAFLLLASWLLSGKFAPSSGTLLPNLTPGAADRKEAFPVLPDDKRMEDVLRDVKTTLEEGKDGRTGIRIDVPGSSSNK